MVHNVGKHSLLEEHLYFKHTCIPLQGIHGIFARFLHALKVLMLFGYGMPSSSNMHCNKERCWHPFKTLHPLHKTSQALSQAPLIRPCNLLLVQGGRMHRFHQAYVTFQDVTACAKHALCAMMQGLAVVVNFRRYLAFDHSWRDKIQYEAQQTQTYKTCSDLLQAELWFPWAFQGTGISSNYHSICPFNDPTLFCTMFGCFWSFVTPAGSFGWQFYSCRTLHQVSWFNARFAWEHDFKSMCRNKFQLR